MSRRCWTACSRASAWASERTEPVARRPAASGGCCCRARERGDLLRTGAYCPGEAACGNRGLGHARTEEVAAALGQHVAIDGAGIVAHPAGEITESQAETGVIEVAANCPDHHRLELADARTPPAAVAGILPDSAPG